MTEAQTVLSVCDDGPGYNVPDDVTSFARSGRYGLLGMHAQAEAIGADFSIESTPGRTVVRVAAPNEG